MALLDPKMGLRLWDQLNDPYDHAQLADNFSKIGFHDHTLGRGVQIPAEGLLDGAVTGAKLDATILSGWKPLLTGTAFTSTTFTNGTYGLGMTGAVTATTSLVTGSNPIYIDPADYAVAGRTAEFRLKAAGFISNNAAPAATFTFGIAPITAVAGTGGTLAATVGANVGATAVLTTPAASSRVNATSAIIAPGTLVAGYYMLTFTVSVTTGSTAQLYRSELQVHNI